MFTDTDDMKSSLKKEEPQQFAILITLITILVILVMLFFVFYFICAPVVIEGNSMAPTLHNGDIILITKTNKNPELNDIIVYKKPTDNKTKVIKRVVGIEGNVFTFSYDTARAEGFLCNTTTNISYPINSEQYHALYERYLKTTFTVQEGEVFAIGDNKRDSVDCRNYGAVSVKSIVGINKRKANQ